MERMLGVGRVKVNGTDFRFAETTSTLVRNQDRPSVRGWSNPADQ
jgi:hypothetical protein